MRSLRPILAVILDSKGDFSSWFESAELRRGAEERLPLPLTYIGLKQREVEPWYRSVVAAEGEPLPEDQLQSIIVSHLSELKDAERLRQLANEGIHVEKETLLLVIGGCADRLVFNHLIELLKFLRRLVARSFAEQHFHFGTVLMLPSLFSSVTKQDDFARTYILLRRLDGYQEEPPPFQVARRGVRLLNSIWLANSTNEEGQIVGRFPEAGHALTSFLQGLLSGAFPCDHAPVAVLSNNKRPNYSSFGCAALCLDRVYLNDYLSFRLNRLLLGPAFLSHPQPSREMMALEVQKFVRRSELPKLGRSLDCDENGTPLWSGFHFFLDNEKAFRLYSVLRELTERREVFLRDSMPETLIRLQQRREQMEVQSREEVAAAVREVADRLGMCASPEFLYTLVEDPPGDTELSLRGDDTTVFGLLGRAIDSLDEFIGYTEPREKLQRAADAVATLRAELTTTKRQADELRERVQSFDAERASIRKLPRSEQEALELEYQRQKADLATSEENIRVLRQKVQSAQAELRGLSIGRRNFQIDERDAAVSRRTEELERNIKAAENAYQTAVQSHRDQQAGLDELHNRRRGWVYRRAFVYPSLTLASLALLNILAILLPGFSVAALVAWYISSSVLLGKVLLLAIIIYGGISLWQDAVGLRLAIHRREQNLLAEEVLAKAWDLVARVEASLRFEFDLRRLYGVVCILCDVRERSRQWLTQTRGLLKDVIQWTAAGPPVPRPDDLYQAAALDSLWLDRIFECFVPDPKELVNLFRGEMGPPSSWIYLNGDGARQRLGQFAKRIFQPLEAFSLEEIIVHPRYGMLHATERLLALYKAAAPYLLLKHDQLTLGPPSSSHEVLLIYEGSHSRCAQLLRGHGITLRSADYPERDKLVVVRVRTGLPAYLLAEIDSYWRDYLRVEEALVPFCAPEENFSELIPSVFLQDYELAVETFLVLWCMGEISNQPDGYHFASWAGSLGNSRRGIYGRLVDDVAWDELFKLMARRAAEVRSRLRDTPERLSEVVHLQPLDYLERRIVARLANGRGVKL